LGKVKQPLTAVLTQLLVFLGCNIKFPIVKPFDFRFFIKLAKANGFAKSVAVETTQFQTRNCAKRQNVGCNIIMIVVEVMRN